MGTFLVVTTVRTKPSLLPMSYSCLSLLKNIMKDKYLVFFQRPKGIITLQNLQVVELLTGLERFVRLCIERKVELSADGKSPKVFGAPKPYTGLYGPSSYMANRPR